MAKSEIEQSRTQFNQFPEKLWLAIVLAVTLLTFASTFTFGWVYDDPPQIVANANLRWDRVSYLFTHQLWDATGVTTETRFYRPFLSVWFLINKTIFGLNPHLFHLTSVIAHVAATALVFFVARKSLRDTSGALIAAAIFGVHPLQTEPVSWISAVNDSLAAIFCFISFLACRESRELRQNRIAWWTAAGTSFLCAVLVKEVSAVLPAIVLVDLWAEEAKSVARSTATVVGLYGTLAVAWLLIRHHVLGRAATVHPFASWSATFLTAPKIFLFHLGQLIYPGSLSPHYEFHLVSSNDMPKALLPLVVTGALAVVAVLAACKVQHLWVAYAWLVVPLLPSLNPRWLNEGDFVHDRYMYISMAGVALLAGAGFAGLHRRWPEQKLIPGLAGALVIGLAFATAIQSQFWANDVSLFGRAVQIAPGNEWSQLNYGAALSERNRYADAAPHFVRSYELRPGWYAADYAGFAYQNTGDPGEAQRWFTRALQLNPQLVDAWFGLGQAQLAEHRPKEAAASFQKALALHPDADGYHFALGSALEQSGETQAALDAYQAELRLHPHQAGARSAIERLASPRNAN